MYSKLYRDFWTNLCSVISINLDVTVGERNGNDVEGHNYGMISSVFICYHSPGKLPFYICVSLKVEQFNIRQNTTRFYKAQIKK